MHTLKCRLFENSGGGIKSRIDTAEEKINKLEDTAIDAIQTKV